MIETAALKPEEKLVDFKAAIATLDQPKSACERPFISAQSEISAIAFYFTKMMHLPSKEC